MELQEFIAEKHKLETHLAEIIANAVKTFKEKTGYSPNAIDVHMVFTTEIGDLKTQYHVSHVTTNIDL